MGQPLAGAVVALMYAGGNVLEEIAVARAEGSLRALIDRAPRVAHRRIGDHVEDAPVERVQVGDQLIVKAGEVVPVDGNVVSQSATIDELALTGEPIPVAKARGARVFSGTLNAGATFEIDGLRGRRATAPTPASSSLVTAAQTAKAPFVRLADRYALLFLPLHLRDRLRRLVDLGRHPSAASRSFVAATPCPLILAAPVAFIAGVAQFGAARHPGQRRRPASRRWRARTRFCSTRPGTLTVGGARLLSIEPRAGEKTLTMSLKLGASLEQASHHVLASRDRSGGD